MRYIYIKLLKSKKSVLVCDYSGNKQQSLFASLLRRLCNGALITCFETFEKSSVLGLAPKLSPMEPRDGSSTLPPANEGDTITIDAATGGDIDGIVSLTCMTKKKFTVGSPLTKCVIFD